MMEFDKLVQKYISTGRYKRPNAREWTPGNYGFTFDSPWFPNNVDTVVYKIGDNLYDIKCSGNRWIISPYKGGWKWEYQVTGGGITEIKYFKDKKFSVSSLHRLDGPALKRGTPDATIEQYWIDGKQYTRKDFISLRKLGTSDLQTVIDLSKI